MRVIKLFFVLILVGVIGVGVWDFALAPGAAKRDAHQAAQDAADAAAHKIFSERAAQPTFSILSADARAAADARAKAAGATVTVFKIDNPDPIVHVTVNKQAKSILIQHIGAFKDFAEVNESASATPR